MTETCVKLEFSFQLCMQIIIYDVEKIFDSFWRCLNNKNAVKIESKENEYKFPEPAMKTPSPSFKTPNQCFPIPKRQISNTSHQNSKPGKQNSTPVPRNSKTVIKIQLPFLKLCGRILNKTERAHN